MKELVPIVFFLTVGLSWYFFIQARTRERLACIEKGLDVMPSKRKPVNTRKTVFTIGLFLIGIAIGLIIGHFMDKELDFEEEVAYFSMILLFGGLSLVISNLIKFRKEE